MRFVRYAFVGTAWLFLACVVVQVFLAGLGVFAGAENFELHRGFGYLFGWLTLVLLVLALIGRLGGRWVGRSALLLLLFALQSVFVALREPLPALAALHPVNALVIFYVAQLTARGSRAVLPAAASSLQPSSEPARP
ncbi:MAG TPA: DUF6220 domain-containing protein [Candidatus Limnocylindria bacterium]|nr:DUF6220 domain-containing protein [Candidatus Limnocylindria bacterium]